MNIAIISSPDAVTQTFIRAHIDLLKDKTFFYYRKNAQMHVHGKGRISSIAQNVILYLYGRFAKKNKFLNDNVSLPKSWAENQIDVILVEYGPKAVKYLPAIVESAIPFVVHFHGYDASRYSVIEKFANDYKSVFKEASYVIGVSKVMIKMLKELGCPDSKLVYNVYGPNDIFLDIIPTYAQDQFIAIGRFVEKKAPEVTIQAFAQVTDIFPQAKLIMAGDGPLLNKCKSLAQKLGIDKNVSFPGIISPNEYGALCAHSLAFVQHSVRATDGDMEGTPLAVLEASAAGLPVISTIHAGIPDVIIHGETGLLCEEHQVDEMARNMISILSNKENAMKMGRAGKQNIKTNFTLKRHLSKLNNILRKAADKT